MIIETPRYLKAKGRLPDHVRRILAAKVQLLAANPAHPGLKAHKLRNADASECSIGRCYRLIFRYQGNDLVLLDVGKHSMIDRLRRKAG